MSIRIMADGKAYDRTDCREVRKYHRAVPSDVRHWVCEECGGRIHKVNWGAGPVFYRHNPGTFWENDMPRWR